MGANYVPYVSLSVIGIVCADNKASKIQDEAAPKSLSVVFNAAARVSLLPDVREGGDSWGFFLWIPASDPRCRAVR